MDIINSSNCVGEIINIGGDEEISILNLAKRVINLTKSNSKINLIPYDQVYGKDFDDMKRRVPSLKKIQKLIGYKPKYSLDEALKKIINAKRSKNG
jgi:UDP-glucose 4-epimerase